MGNYTSEGCERLARALTELAAGRGFNDLRAVAGPFFHGEAVVLEPSKEQWAEIYDFLADVVEELDSSFVNAQVFAKHGELTIAIVPLTSDAANELAQRVEELS